MKTAFVEWSSQDQARFISELGYHGESKAVVIFLKKYGNRNHVVFDAALSVLADLGCFHEMEQVLIEMGSSEISPSSVTLAAMLRSVEDMKDILEIRERFRETEALWTTEVFTAAIRACTGGNDNNENVWDMIVEIRQWMNDAKVQATAPIYLAIFQACANMQHASSEVVSSLFNETVRVANENPAALQFDDRLWGTILQAFAASRDDSASLEVLRVMNSKGFIPNGRHCTTFIKTLSLCRKDKLARKFLNKMLGEAVEEFEGLKTVPPDQICVLAVLSALAVNDNYKLANDLLQQMKARKYGENVPPNEQAYNLVLSTCRSPKRALEIVREMRLTRRHRIGVITPSLRTYSKAIAVCRKAGDLRIALTLLEKVKDDGLVPDVYVYSAVIWTAAEIGNCDNARLVMQEMKLANVSPNIVTYNGLMSAYAAAGRFEEIILTFSEIQGQLEATWTTFNIIFRAARTLADTTERCAFLEEVYRQMRPRDKHVSTGGQLIECLVFALGSQGRFDEANEAFESLLGPCDAPNLRAMLFACSNAQPPAWEHALEILHTSDIVLLSEPPAYVDSVALAYAMLACSKADRWEESLNLLRIYGNKETSVVAFNSLIAACGRCSRPDVAIEVLNEMESHGINPDELSFRNAIIACNQAEHARARASRVKQISHDTGKRDQALMFDWWECALSLIRRMKESGLTPDIQTYSSVISACEAAGKWQRALGLLQEMKEEEKNLYCFNAAISACEKGGAWVEALELYELMKERGGSLKPNFISVGSVVMALDQAGQKEMSTSVYDEAARSGILKPWKTTKNSRGQSIRALDLHQFSGSLARAAVRSHLESLFSRPRTVTEDLVIVVGKGLHSTSRPVLGSAVSSLCEEYGIKPSFDGSNAGRLVISRESLQELIKTRG